MQTVYARPVIARDDVKIHAIDTDFQNFPADPQPRILPGTWTLDGYVAPEVGRNNTPRYTANPNSWTYGPGQSGSINYHGLYPTARGARLFYTPDGGKYDDMKVRAGHPHHRAKSVRGEADVFGGAGARRTGRARKQRTAAR